MSLALSPSRIVIRLAQAGVKRTASLFRAASGRDFAGWADRAEVCARCPLVVVQCGKSYCGRPFLRQIDRDEPTEGCGCPIAPKAKDPSEHCPRDGRFSARTTDDAGACTCMWCRASRAARSAHAPVDNGPSPLDD
jgi:hypothetical protein